MKKILLCLVVIFTLTGCLPRVELRDRAIAQCFGVDFEDNEYTVTLQIFESGDKGSGENKSQLISAKGMTITDAIYNINSILGKEVFLGNNKTIIIGEDSAKDGIEYITGFFNGDYQTGIRTNIAVCKGKAENFVSRKDKNGNNINFKNMEYTLNESINQGIIPKSDIISVETAMGFEDNSAFILGYIDSYEINGEIFSKIEGGALFKGGKMIELLDKEISKGVSIVIGKPKYYSVNLENDNGEYMTVIGKSPKKKIDYKKGKLNIDIKFEGNITEVILKDGRELSFEEIKKAEKLCENYIQNTVDKALKTCVIDNDCDILKLEDLEENNAELSININAKCSLERHSAELRGRR